MLNVVKRAAHILHPARSKERYFSAQKWDLSWSQGYDLDRAPEDARYGALLSLVERHGQDGPILDVGCGDGLLEQHHRKLSNVPVVAFDYSAEAIERAKTRELSDVEFLCRDIRTFQSQQRFSAIVFNESLYYVDDYLIYLRQLSMNLTAGGVFIVSMYSTPVVKKIWKTLLRSYTSLHGVALEDEKTKALWHIRVLKPNRTASRIRSAQ